MTPSKYSSQENLYLGCQSSSNSFWVGLYFQILYRSVTYFQATFYISLYKTSLLQNSLINSFLFILYAQSFNSWSKGFYIITPHSRFAFTLFCSISCKCRQIRMDRVHTWLLHFSLRQRTFHFHQVKRDQEYLESCLFLFIFNPSAKEEASKIFILGFFERNGSFKISFLLSLQNN